MTAAARIRQDDIQRAIKSAKKEGCQRVVVDLANQRIEIILDGAVSSVDEPNPWDEE